MVKEKIIEKEPRFGWVSIIDNESDANERKTMKILHTCSSKKEFN